MITIVAFGDSITLAVSGNIEERLRWPSLLEAGLRERFPGRDLRVVNAGVGGNTSREGLVRMDADVVAHAPEIVLVEFGGNDATPQSDRHVPLEEFRANLAAMKGRLDRFGAVMVLMTFPPVVDRNHAWYEQFKGAGGQDAVVERYRGLTRAFAREHGLPLVDLDAAIRRDPRAFIMGDGVHLTPAGNRAAFEAVLPVVAAQLSSRGTSVDR